MRSLGLDVGDKRTGVAVSDPMGILATPLTVLDARDEDNAIDEIIKLVEQYEAGRIVIGLPRRLDGDIGRQAEKVKAFTEKLRNVITSEAKQSHFNGVDIQLWDERLSTKAAERLMMESVGKGHKTRSKKKNKAKASASSAKNSVDAMAAAYILQGFLDSLEGEKYKYTLDSLDAG